MRDLEHTYIRPLDVIEINIISQNYLVNLMYICAGILKLIQTVLTLYV